MPAIILCKINHAENLLSMYGFIKYSIATEYVVSDNHFMSCFAMFIPDTDMAKISCNGMQKPDICQSQKRHIPFMHGLYQNNKQ